MSYEADPGLLPGASSSLGLGPAAELEGPREQAGGCAPQGSGSLLRATHWPGPGVEAVVNLFPIPASDKKGQVPRHNSYPLSPGPD